MRAGRGRAARSSPCEVETADGSSPRASYAVPDWEARAAALPPAPPRIRLLSPFDPILRDRKRTLRLFGFDYRFEAFVPERRSGGTATTCCRSWKASAWSAGSIPSSTASEGLLEVRQLWWEPGVRESKGRRAALKPPSTGWRAWSGPSAGVVGEALPPRPLQRPLHEQVLAGARLLARRRLSAGRRCRRTACPRLCTLSASWRSRIALSSSWSRGSSTGTIASTRESRLRDIQSAEPMKYSGCAARWRSRRCGRAPGSGRRC